MIIPVHLLWCGYRHQWYERRGKLSLTCANLLACPNPGASDKVYIPRPGHSGFLRTYSARIYFIVSNSSLACLHMPHPSNPVDDTSAHSYNREHGRLVRSRGRLVRSSGELLQTPRPRASEEGVRLIDFFVVTCFVCWFLSCNAYS